MVNEHQDGVVNRHRRDHEHHACEGKIVATAAIRADKP
jgi:hypothetical protein